MADGNKAPERILVEAHTSSPILDKSSDEPFTIILFARVDHHRPITIDALMTVLYTLVTVLDDQGLTFKDTSSGTYAERGNFNFLMEPPERLTATTDSVVELPPRDVEKPYTVSHTFQRLPDSLPDLSLGNLSDEQKELVSGISHLRDQTKGLEPGHTYEIGLGEHMSSVRSWREGSKAEVFSRGSLPSSALTGPPIRMELLNTVTFRVADGGDAQDGAGETGREE